MVRLAAILSIGLAAADARASSSEAARAAFERGTKLFEAEEYSAALPEFRAAYELSGRRPTAVFALAQCERALALYEDSIAHFSEYLATGPENEAEIEETIGLLEIQKEKRDAERMKAEAEAEQRRLEEARRLSAEEERIRERELELAKKEAMLEAERVVAATDVPPPPADIEADASTSVFESPWFWVITGAVVVGGAVAATVVVVEMDDGYAGSSGVRLEP
jgi:tetratricopeptide (TPR) repeat protein